MLPCRADPHTLLTKMTEFSFLIWIGVAIAGVLIFFYFVPVNLWIVAVFSGVNVGLVTLIFMRLRKVPPGLIVQSMILATKAGIKGITINQLETHFLARGNLRSVIKALVVADKANLELNYQQATAIDLAGRDVLRAVQLSVSQLVILVPPVTGVSVEGIELITEARVTVRANIRRLGGGGADDTGNARVGQGMISTVGKPRSYLHVLGSPES